LQPDNLTNQPGAAPREVSGKGSPRVIVACGGTGGHLFPGFAVAEELLSLGCQVTALISTKTVDAEAARTAPHIPVETVEAVGFSSGKRLACITALVRSFQGLRKKYHAQPPVAVLAMGGFTSAAPLVAARHVGSCTFLHESNAYPGRANRWLSRFVDVAFVGFAEAEVRLKCARTIRTGTPVRSRFKPQDPALCRASLGLHPRRPVLLVLGGSQGARGVNRAVVRSLPQIQTRFPELQFLHLAGPNDFLEVQSAYQALQLTAVVKPFFAEMEMALGAATLAVSRSGASTLAELSAMSVPSVLVPYPLATDNHQYANARAYENSGAARIVRECSERTQELVEAVSETLSNETKLFQMGAAAAKWHRPFAAREIAATIMQAVEQRFFAVPPAGRRQVRPETDHLSFSAASGWECSPKPAPAQFRASTI
jgi:UDP-N-acetylglucosamine--N-acetylmuramyl-(pentapeptide) pyrophosphoryl-undecaprenol N-acetylglucosamine transferase